MHEAWGNMFGQSLPERVPLAKFQCANPFFDDWIIGGQPFCLCQRVGFVNDHAALTVRKRTSPYDFPFSAKHIHVGEMSWSGACVSGGIDNRQNRDILQPEPLPVMR